MRRLLVACVAVLCLAGCTPEEQRWYAWWGRAYEGGSLPCGQWVGTSRIGGFTEDDLPTVHRLMKRESGCIASAHSRSDDWGLMQINAGWLGQLCRAGIACTRADLTDPQVNLRAALFVRYVQGWNAWATYR